MFIHLQNYFSVNSFMVSKEHVINESLQLFRKMGIRSVTMDYIAEHLGMSKRTLYELFSKKEDLLTECLKKVHEEHRLKAQEILSTGEHIIEIFILFMRYHINDMKQYHPMFYYDLQKYYAEMACPQTEYFQTNMVTNIQKFVEDGKNQGVFRPDINSEIVAKLLIEQFKIATNENLFPREKYLPSDIFEHISINFLRGIATIQGIEIIEKYYQKHL